MTAYQLSSTRLMLERARLLLGRYRGDPDASEMLGVLSDVIAAIAIAEASSALPTGAAARLLGEGRAVYERAKLFCAQKRIPFLEVITPYPRHDTDRALDTMAVLAALADMKPGAMAPPEELLPTLLEAVHGPDLSPREPDTIPSPPNTLSSLETGRPGPRSEGDDHDE